MASYHCSIQKPISRAKGESVVHRAAYNARTQYRDERTGELTKDYGYKKDLLKSFVAFDPKTGAPDWIKNDPQRMLTAAVAAERRKDAREGQQIIVGLVHELGPEKSQWMLNDFIREQLTRGTGRVVYVNIHAAPDHGDDRNIHAHLLLLPREAGPEGFGDRLPALKPEDYDRLREKWAEKGAKELRKAGYEPEAERFAVGHLDIEKQRAAALKRGDHEWAKQLDREAQKHRGPAADAMERKGAETGRGNIYRDMDDRAALPGLKAELAELEKQIGIEHEAQREIQWQDAIAHAAIEKEKIERRFVEPTPAPAEPARGTLAGGKEQEPEKHWPAPPPQPNASTNPALFTRAGREATAASSPQEPPENLQRTAAQIWVTYNRSHTPEQFAAALEEKNMRLAAATKDEADQSHREAEFAKALGNTAPRFKEGEIVVVTEPRLEYRREGQIVELRRVFQLNQRTTGEDRREVEKFMGKLDRAPLQGIEATKQALDERAQQRRDDITAARMDRTTTINDRARPANDNGAPLPGKAAGRVVLGIGDAVADTFGGIISFLVPAPPKTPAEIKSIEEERERDAADDRRATRDREHERITETHAEQRQQEQEREQYRKRQRDRER